MWHIWMLGKSMNGIVVRNNEFDIPLHEIHLVHLVLYLVSAVASELCGTWYVTIVGLLEEALW
jgi:hypothetical protein